MPSDQIKIGIADMNFAKKTGTLITYALGSCIGICLYDPAIALAGMIHIMLPTAPAGGDSKTLKYADSGIAEMLRKMEALGGSRARYTAKIAGGAKMFEIAGDNTVGGIGARNTVVTKTILRSNGIKITGEDTGLSHARTMIFEAATGKVVIRSFGKPDNTL
jgi:chemotaxis protein CheD